MEDKNEKKKVREKILAQRRSLPITQRTEFSKVISCDLLELPELKDADNILSYKILPGEVDLTQLNSIMEQQGKKVLIPAPTPEETLKEKFAVAIVPGVAFDLQGYRLGRGGGYYDKLLSKANCTAVGVCFDFQLLPSLPHEPHDVRMNCIVTEKRVLQF